MAWHRILQVAATLASTLGAIAGCSVSHPPEKPNIALFIIDTLRADAMGCYGSSRGSTPELDALAARGVRFETIYAQTSWTRPSVASMLTGRQIRSLGIYNERVGILGDRFTTLAEVLRDQGYSTFGITANPHLNRAYNFQQGFDSYVDSDTVFSFMPIGGRQSSYEETSLATAREMFARVAEFVDRHPGTPTYVQVALMEVHEWGRGKGSLTRAEFARSTPRSPFTAYYSAVRQVSADLAAFVAELESRRGWDDALFVFVSDHGEGLDSQPSVQDSVFHGPLLYESQLRVPLVIYRPGWNLAGRSVSQRGRLLDFMPTVLDAAGLAAPPGLDGISLLPAAREPEVELPLPELFVAETFFRGHRKAAVYGRHYKYYENYDHHPGTALRELQQIGAEEDGARTSVLDEERPTAKAMHEFLETWKRNHPKAKMTRHEQEPSAEAMEQLRSMGYIDR